MEARKAVWEVLRPFRMKLLRLAPAKFIHFGTTREILELMETGVEDYTGLGWSRSVSSSVERGTAAGYMSVLSSGAECGSEVYLEVSSAGSDPGRVDGGTPVCRGIRGQDAAELLCRESPGRSGRGTLHLPMLQGVLLNGQMPVTVRLAKLNERKVVLSSADMGVYGEFCSMKGLQSVGDPYDPYVLQKAALIACGIIPESGGNLEAVLAGMGGGFQMDTEVAGVPMGSGLGTSSILAAACVKALFAFTGTECTEQDINPDVDAL